MRKAVLCAVLCAAALAAGCGGSKDKAGPSASPETDHTRIARITSPPEASAGTSPAAPLSSASAGTAGKTEDSPAGEAEDGAEKMDVIEPEAEPETVDETSKKTDFTGIWRASATTSGNAAFESLTLEITSEGYTVSMTFENIDGSTTYSGEYDIRDGVLVFDENFAGCTAYFYEDSADTLVLDNGTSLVFCEHQETEAEMR